MVKKDAKFLVVTFRQFGKDKSPGQGIYFYDKFQPWRSNLYDFIEDMGTPLVIKDKDGIWKDNIVSCENYSSDQITRYIEENDTDFIKTIDTLVKGAKIDKVKAWQVDESEKMGINKLIPVEWFLVSETLNELRNLTKKAIDKKAKDMMKAKKGMGIFED